ncbi:NAD-dependent epimerase/dehydratase family protein, partial [bacterium]|nr:NAD-dependent epimerase/dehydratase family protein [bacterium]
MKVLVTGASGLIGTALIASLNADGQEAIPLRRQRLEGATPAGDPEHGST